MKIIYKKLLYKIYLIRKEIVMQSNIALQNINYARYILKSRRIFTKL